MLLYCVIVGCVERALELKPASEAKRLKTDNEEDEEHFEDIMDTDDDQGFVQENLEISAASTLTHDECAELVTCKSLDERQREFKHMLLERGVSYSYLCHHAASYYC